LCLDQAPGGGLHGRINPVTSSTIATRMRTLPQAEVELDKNGSKRAYRRTGRQKRLQQRLNGQSRSFVKSGRND
jgi:hypothetical protein